LRQERGRSWGATGIGNHVRSFRFGSSMCKGSEMACIVVHILFLGFGDVVMDHLGKRWSRWEVGRWCCWLRSSIARDRLCCRRKVAEEKLWGGKVIQVVSNCRCSAHARRRRMETETERKKKKKGKEERK
jgi:hypothetical protein